MHVSIYVSMYEYICIYNYFKRHNIPYQKRGQKGQGRVNEMKACSLPGYHRFAHQRSHRCFARMLGRMKIRFNI